MAVIGMQTMPLGSSITPGQPLGQVTRPPCLRFTE